MIRQPCHRLGIQIADENSGASPIEGSGHGAADAGGTRRYQDAEIARLLRHYSFLPRDLSERS